MSSKKTFLFRMCLIGTLLLLLVYISLSLPTTLAPDEAMRDQIPYWIYNHNALPTGEEAELINNPWGFSYATLPFLPALVSYVFMKLASLATSNEQIIFQAMRFTSILSACGCLFFAFKIGDKLFQRRISVYLFAAVGSLLPQVVFLSSYYNNDAIALLGAYVTFYYLLAGRNSQWAIRDCIGLAIGLSIIILSYYNAYGWVLISILFFIGSCFSIPGLTKKKQIQRTISRGSFIFLLVFLLAGWFFIRNAVLHNGDFLGRETCRLIAANYEAQGHTVYHPSTLMMQGSSLLDILFDGVWIKTSLESFIGVFGNMNLFMSSKIYYLYILFLGFGAVSGIVFAVVRKQEGLFHVCLIIAIIIPVVLSIYYSFSSDYQPQGRYIMPLLPAFAYYVAYGYEQLFLAIEKKAEKHANIKKGVSCVALFSITGIWSLLCCFACFKYMLPQISFKESISCNLSDDCSTLDLSCDVDAKYQQIMFAVWNDADQSDLQWFAAQPYASNDYWNSTIWKYKVNLSKYGKSGTYNIHIYGLTDTGVLEFIDEMYPYAESAAHANYFVVSQDETDGTYTITMEPVEEYSNVVFALWERGETQADWVKAEYSEEKGSWIAEVSSEGLEKNKFDIIAYEQGTEDGLIYLGCS